jgi:mannosylglycerate hydrolase
MRPEEDSASGVFVVPHTHWDREWYRPFQWFRMSLVDVVDEVLELLEANERMRFTLDGQLATVDDYVEIRRDGGRRIRALVESGRLAIGPWQTLPDEFLVSGESLFRNLEAGLARAEEFGGAMRVGYLPDSFGHVAQMPQILRLAGIETAVVWRGVPSAVRSHAFTWEAPDGSYVRAEYLPEGYSNAAYVFNAATTDLAPLEERLRPWFPAGPVLGMVGTDHMPPVRDLPSRVPPGAEIGTIAAFLALQQAVTRDRWVGELRSAARANLLPNVASARIDIKAACARAELALERYAEPLHALHGDEWPTEFLDEAWRRVLQNAAHDSVCGCSADEVSAQVLVRYAEAEQIGTELAQRVVRRLASDVPGGAVAVLNPSPHARADVVELELEVPDEWPSVALEGPDGGVVATQEIGRQDPLLFERRLDDVGRHLRRSIHGRELFGRTLNGYGISGDVVTVDVGDAPDPLSLDVDELLREIELATAAGAWTLRIVARPRRTLVARVEAPPLGCTSVRARRSEATPAAAYDDLPATRIVRGGDDGDSYTYAPPPDDVIVDTPVAEALDVVEDGPVRRVSVLVRTYRWDGHEVATETRFEQRAGERFTRVAISFDNPCDDQRVRVHVPLREAAAGTLAEGQFAIVERRPHPEGGHGEEPVGTYPASTFVAAGGVVLLLRHVTEYELVDGRELALTVLRSIGLISRSANRYRDEPAGPELPIPAAQMRGRHRFEFAVSTDVGRALAHAEAYRLPFLTAPGTAAHPELRALAGPELSGATLASLRRRNGRLEARVVNETPRASTARFGDATAELRPWEIRTLHL